jgi:hypothetical protein
MPNLQYHTKPKLAVGDEAGMRPARSVSSTASFTDLPYELLELIA